MIKSDNRGSATRIGFALPFETNWRTEFSPRKKITSFWLILERMSEVTTRKIPEDNYVKASARPAPASSFAVKLAY